MNLTVRLTVVALVLTAAACAMRTQIYTPGADVTAPVLVTEQRPYYPAEAQRAKIQGAVWLTCVVLPDGTVDDVQVVRSLDTVHGLDTQAVEALKQWTFEPGTKDGVPVPVRVTAELTFTLK